MDSDAKLAILFSVLESFENRIFVDVLQHWPPIRVDCCFRDQKLSPERFHQAVQQEKVARGQVPRVRGLGRTRD